MLRECPDHPGCWETRDNWGRTYCTECGVQLAWREVTDPLVLIVNPTIMQGGRPACSKCGQTGCVHLMRTVQINGNSLVYWRCEQCDRRASEHLSHPPVLRYLAYARVRWPHAPIPATIDDIPVKYDNRTGQPCFVCGSHAGVEYHHFLPRAFRDHPDVAQHWRAWDLCGAWLCRPHHEVWHNLVAPLHALAEVRR